LGGFFFSRIATQSPREIHLAGRDGWTNVKAAQRHSLQNHPPAQPTGKSMTFAKVGVEG
jgi:hypothetical protein